MPSIKSIIKNKVSTETIQSLIVLQQRLLHLGYLGFKYQCPICQTHLRKFISLNDIADGLFVRDLVINSKTHKMADYETLNIEHFLCPICGAQDKARLYDIYLDSILPKLAKKFKSTNKLRLVHFAPEGGLGEKLKKYTFIKYKSADLERDDVDEKADLTKLHYKNSSLDMFICSHILEHIPDDVKAIKELYRVLKKDGFGILMVPLLLSLNKTYYDPSIKTPKSRLKHFGQQDHVRVYSKNDFLSKLKHAGFTIKQLGSEHFGNDVYTKHAITPQSVLYIVVKE